MMFVQATSAALQRTGMSETHAQATATGIITSAGVTFIALAAGVLVQSTIDGVRSPAMLWTWMRDGHLWFYAVTQIVAPGLRGYLAHRNSTENVSPPGATP